MNDRKGALTERLDGMAEALNADGNPALATLTLEAKYEIEGLCRDVAFYRQIAHSRQDLQSEFLNQAESMRSALTTAEELLTAGDTPDVGNAVNVLREALRE